MLRIVNQFVSQFDGGAVHRYSKFEDRFLRVGFASDSLQALNHTDLSDAVVGRFRSLMLHGLHLCNRKFVFLGFSSSQQRNHGCWLYCEENRYRFPDANWLLTV